MLKSAMKQHLCLPLVTETLSVMCIVESKREKERIIVSYLKMTEGEAMEERVRGTEAREIEKN